MSCVQVEYPLLAMSREEEAQLKEPGTLEHGVIQENRKRKTLASSKASSKKKVRFTSHCPTDVPCGPNFQMLSKHEKKNIWWCCKELHSIKERARSLARVIYEMRHTTDFEYSYSRIMDRVFRQHGNISKQDELKLWIWISQAHSRRGLERWSAQDVGYMRRSKARAHILEILRVQRLLKQRKVDAGIRAEVLSVVSDEHTKPAKALAHLFGKADAVAVTVQETDQSLI